MLTTPIVFERYKSIKSGLAQMLVVEKTCDFSLKQYQAGYLKVLQAKKFKAARGSGLARSTDMSEPLFFKLKAAVQRGIDATDR